MAEPAAPDFARTRLGMAALARSSGDGENDPERNRVADNDRFAAFGLQPNQARGSSANLTEALIEPAIGEKTMVSLRSVRSVLMLSPGKLYFFSAISWSRSAIAAFRDKRTRPFSSTPRHL